MEFKRNNIVVRVSNIGAELKSFNVSGVEYIWKSDSTYWKRSAPILFPIVGALKNGKTIINGKEYSLTQHGFLRDRKFSFVSFIEKKESSKITYKYVSNELDYQLYPFKFKAYISYIIKDNSIETFFEIKNTDQVEMYFNIGGHPAINCPLFDNEVFDDYKIVFDNKISFDSPKINSDATLDFNNPVLKFKDIMELNLKKELFSVDTIIIKEPKFNSLSFVNKNNQGIRFSFKGFNTFALWTPFNDAPFICLEPWCGYNDLMDSNNLFLSKDDLICLEVGKKQKFSYKIELI